MKKRDMASSSLLYLGALILAVGFCMPYLWMISTSLKTPIQVMSAPVQWIPNPVTFRNFPDVWRLINFGRALMNTLIITVSSVLGTVFSTYTVAFGFARLNFKGKDFIFMLVLATVMIPPQVTYIPLYIIFRKLGWIDTFKPFWVPALFGGGLFGGLYIFLLRQFLLSIPKELEDSGRIDGCSTFGLYRRVFLPLSKAGLTAVGILSFVFYWNLYFGPLIFINSNDKKPLVLLLALLKDNQGGQFYNQVMAAALMSVVPCVLIYIFAQKTFVKGIVMSGLKG